MTYQCPDCRNEFVQPFKCATCGAQKLYDTTMNTLAANLARAEARLAEAERDAARYRFLQAESKRFDPVLGVTCKVHFDRNGSDWCNIVDLDATVDRCRATDSADDAPEKCLDCGKTIDLCGCAL